MDSIMNTKPGECFICGKKTATERHHVCFGVGLRKISEELGLIVYLCPEHHRGTYGVHGKDGNEINRYLKKQAQFEFEKTHAREEWMQRIGRNYL